MPKSYRYNSVPNRFSSRFSTSRTNAPRLLSRAKVCTHSALLKGSHTAAHTPKQGPSLLRSQLGFVLPAKFPLFRLLLYTYISRFSVNPQHQQKRIIRQSCRHKFYPQPLFNFSYKRPTFAFTGESGHTLGSRRKIAHSGSHAETRGVSDGGWYHYPRSVPHVSETLRGRVSERQTLPLLWLGRWCSQRTQRAFGTAMRLCASLSRRRRGPAGLRDPVVRLLMLRFSVSVRKVSARFPANATRSSSHLNPSTTPPALLKESHTAAHAPKRVCP